MSDENKPYWQVFFKEKSKENEDSYKITTPFWVALIISICNLPLSLMAIYVKSERLFFAIGIGLASMIIGTILLTVLYLILKKKAYDPKQRKGLTFIILTLIGCYLLGFFLEYLWMYDYIKL